MARNHKKQKVSQIICFCNNVARSVIENAISEGAQTLDEIYDKTTAGVGPCGGSCRRKIAPILECYLTNGGFSAECEKLSEVPAEQCAGSVSIKGSANGTDPDSAD